MASMTVSLKGDLNRALDQLADHAENVFEGLSGPSTACVFEVLNESKTQTYTYGGNHVCQGVWEDNASPSGDGISTIPPQTAVTFSMFSKGLNGSIAASWYKWGDLYLTVGCFISKTNVHLITTEYWETDPSNKSKYSWWSNYLGIPYEQRTTNSYSTNTKENQKVAGQITGRKSMKIPEYICQFTITD